MNDVFDDSDNRGPGNRGPEEDRTAQVARALLKALVVVVVIGVVIALGTTIMVRALGLNENDSPGPVGTAPSGPTRPLPTTALPVPGDDKSPEQPTESAAASKTPDAKNRDFRLEASPVKAKAMERVNLTGSYKGADNLSLKVQRFENGGWSDFGVDATVRGGTYATYVQTGRAGVQRFRMYDPAAKQASNGVRVTIG